MRTRNEGRLELRAICAGGNGVGGKAGQAPLAEKSVGSGIPGHFSYMPEDTAIITARSPELVGAASTGGVAALAGGSWGGDDNVDVKEKAEV